jgi:hypothetical protein
MAIRLQDWKHANPGYTVGGEGRWLVIWHRGRATRYESYFDAQRDCACDCGYCDGKEPHQIIELAVDTAPKFTPSKSFRRMVEAD